MAILIASTTWRWAGRQSSKKLRNLCGRHGNLESAGDPGRDVDLSPLPEEEPLELRQVGTSGHFAVLIDTSCSASCVGGLCAYAVGSSGAASAGDEPEAEVLVSRA
jgi:hypothetical protein